ncbi:uncharacterized protein LOC119188484 isoform X2 [Manduca sexta]|uniref:uncharacterized protein LOC119188484 isoform X2 n=1 Tax=Manduca sexta TaxID=7130 RepID=UPI00188EF718|nr:uncharacterized protein LOC119188484 isoform X2 [Manduca sexta]
MSTKYYVVNFLNEDKPEYRVVLDKPDCVVVPESWVKYHYSDYTVVLVYPDEVVNEESVRNDETPAAGWKQYLCQIIDICDSYNDAKSAAMQKNEGRKRKTSQMNDRESIEVKRDDNCKRRRTMRSTAHEMNTSNTQTTQESNNLEKVFTQMTHFLRSLIDSATLMLNSVNECTNVNTSMLNVNKDECTNVNTSMLNVSKDTSVNTNSYTKWTLLHQHPGPGLTELMENSKIYVVKNKLDQYTKEANSSTNLIRTVLTLILTSLH